MKSELKPDAGARATPATPLTTPPFYIASEAAAVQQRNATLKHGNTFAVFGPRGDMNGGPGSPEGLYHLDTRILSRLNLTLQGCTPELLSSVTHDDNAVFDADLSNPDLLADGKVALRRELIHLRRTRFLWQGACYDRLVVRNFAHEAQRVTVRLEFAADFADLFEVRGAHRVRRGIDEPVEVDASSIRLAYTGLDDIRRVTACHFSPDPVALDASSASFEMTLAPHEARRIFVRVGVPDVSDTAWDGRCFYSQMRAARAALRSSRLRGAEIVSTNVLFDEVVRRSASDLYMLITDMPEGPYPYAGTPWFSTVFGRDGIITALMMLWFDPVVARGVLHYLAGQQALTVDPERDAEPGKILHEVRHGEMAHTREVPFACYYGSVDSTPLFVLLMGEYYRRTGDTETVAALWPNVEAALSWIDVYGDADGDGFVEYARKNDEGLVNQGWKDSQDAIFHADGQLARGPIALCEVQAYVYGAKSHAAQMARALGKLERATELEGQALSLKERFEDAFWCEELSIYALALDGDKAPCRVVTSNAGQVLLTGIARADRAARVAQTLLEPANYSGWGIRTLSSDSPCYNPMSYHNGSVWPHDNVLIALGMHRYGLKDAVLTVFEGLLEAASHMELRRLPELFCGFTRQRRVGPTLYPVACTPQAWASAATLALIQASLGLEIDEQRGEIVLDHPVLPTFLEELKLLRLRMRDASVDLSLRRIGRDVAVNVIRHDGAVRILTRH